MDIPGNLFFVQPETWVPCDGRFQSCFRSSSNISSRLSLFMLIFDEILLLKKLSNFRRLATGKRRDGNLSSPSCHCHVWFLHIGGLFRKKRVYSSLEVSCKCGKGAMISEDIFRVPLFLEMFVYYISGPILMPLQRRSSKRYSSWDENSKQSLCFRLCIPEPLLFKDG